MNVKEAKCDVKKAKGKVKEAKGIGREACVVIMNDKDNRRYTRPS